MDKLSWSDTLAIGIEEIDRHHRELIGIRNKLVNCCKLDNAPHTEIFHDILADLFEYSRTHFSAEEALMQSIEYPDFDSHRNEHHEFIEQIVDLSIGVARDPWVHTKALDVLTEWLVTHLLQTDLRIRDHIEYRQPC
ncbi:MAG: bacteriohemerythrin [Propionivibrio sp.]